MGAIWMPDGDKILVDYWRLQLARLQRGDRPGDRRRDAVRALAHGKLCELLARRHAPGRGRGTCRGRRSRCRAPTAASRSTCSRVLPRRRLPVALARRSLRRHRPSTAATPTAASISFIFDLQTKADPQPHQRPVRRLQRAPDLVADRRVDRLGLQQGPRRRHRVRLDGHLEDPPGRHRRAEDRRRPADEPLASGTRTCSRAAASRPSRSRRSRSCKPDAAVAPRRPASRVRRSRSTPRGSKPGADEAAIAVVRLGPRRRRRRTPTPRASAPKTSFPDEGTYSVGVLVTDADGGSRDGDGRGDRSPTPARRSPTRASTTASRRASAPRISRPGRGRRSDRQGLLERLRRPARRCR